MKFMPEADITSDGRARSGMRVYGRKWDRSKGEEADTTEEVRLDRT